MIHDLLENVGIYGFDDALLVKAFEYARSFDASTAEGKHEIVGEDLYAMVLGYETKEGEDGVFEAHRRYTQTRWKCHVTEIVSCCLQWVCSIRNLAFPFVIGIY